ncbi:MAG TPA: amylo-alpha-1,6-glucosidase [Fimbriimonadaceae bacterium]
MFPAEKLFPEGGYKEAGNTNSSTGKYPSFMQFVLGGDDCRNLAVSTRKEWLLTNGLGGFAMGTASGINTRRYHGLLVAAIKPPATRMVLLAGIECTVQLGLQEFELSANQYPGAIYPEGYKFIEEFSAGKFVRWKYKSDSFEIWRTVGLHEGENAVSVQYENKGTEMVTLRLRPLVCHKPYHENFYESSDYPGHVDFFGDTTAVRYEGVSLYINSKGGFRYPIEGWYYRFEHQMEINRGLAPRDDLYCPCEMVYTLKPGRSATLVAGTKEHLKPVAFPHEEADVFQGGRDDVASALTQSAAHFLVGSEERTTIIAGYPWFTDWGRDTMIAIPGICLHTGHVDSAKKIMLDFAKQMKQGLIPNRFVEAPEQPQYNTVDATLWYVNAAYLILNDHWDASFAAEMSKVLAKIFEWHQKGTFYGIKADPADGLLTQGEEGVQLTWMDAKIGDWVVTPRHGKPVEISGLWINALRVMEWLAGKLDDGAAKKYGAAAEKAESNFDRKFWNEKRGHYLDTVDPDDASLRPNQVIAMSLPFAPAKGDHALRALSCVEQELVTPRGLRTLGPSEPGYQGRYEGALRQLDAAYHQGTVWPWLLGPYISACKKLRGSFPDPDKWLGEFSAMLREGGLGGIAEVYDGDEPRNTGGCPWQAWSVSELLRVLAEG